ncbi:cytochrome P450 [Nocardia sp. NPDC059691]|uniref:cytochrome P450 n=1 Tax=Nocardia sp. NPDC059691 TaxID=3346908 RepID=UPI003686B3FE
MYIGDSSEPDFAARLCGIAETTRFGRHEASDAVQVFRAEDVRELLRDRRLWSTRDISELVARLPIEVRPVYTRLCEFLGLWPAFSDGPYNRRIRAHLITGLAGAAADEVRAALRRDLSALLAGRVGTRFDWIADVSVPYAHLVLARSIGVSIDEARRVTELGERIMRSIASTGIDVERAEQALAASKEMRDWLEHAIGVGGSRFISAVADIWRDIDSGPQAATAALAQVVTGSYQPLIGVMGALVEIIDADHLRSLPIPVIREEAIRLATPFRYVSRFTRCPMTIGDHELGADGRVMLLLATANVDPSAVPEPLEVRDRPKRANLAFGAGPHYCPGAAVARMAIDIVLEQLRGSGHVFAIGKVTREPEFSVLQYYSIVGELTEASVAAP